MIKPEHKHYFKGIEIGDETNKGKIEDLLFMNFYGVYGAIESYEPHWGKGILMAKINGKNVPIGEVKQLKEMK